MTQKQHVIIAEMRKVGSSKKKKKKADRTVGKPELLEQINDIIKQSGSFGLSGPPA